MAGWLSEGRRVGSGARRWRRTASTDRRGGPHPQRAGGFKAQGTSAVRHLPEGEGSVARTPDI